MSNLISIYDNQFSANAMPSNTLFNPMVIKQSGNGERAYDIFSRIMEDRIIMLFDAVTPESSQLIIAQLLYLASVDDKKDITLYINSPGGSVTDGLAIYDTMNFIKPDVSTVCIGIAASMGAFLLSSGAKGKRFVLPNSEVMIHQPLISGGLGGQQTDITIRAKNLERTRSRLEAILAKNAGKTLDQIHADCERDNFMTAEEAVAYGLVDSIIVPK